MTADPLSATTRPASGTAAPLLAVEDLHVEIASRGRTVHALDGVSLDLAPGEALGIVGESGCGKTMTALSVLGLLPKGGRITGGRVLFRDGTGSPTDLAAAPEPVLRHVRGNTIGMVFQDPLTSLNPTMTIGAQVAEPLLLHQHTTRRDAWAKAEETLRLVGMPQPAERMRNYPHQLSGGMRQRVAIAMALVLRAPAADRRRADHRPRRHHPAPDPGTHRRPARPPRHGDDPGHPRPRRHRQTGGPGRGDVRRQDRRKRRRTEPVRRATAPPVHRGPVRRPPRTRRGRRHHPRHHPRPAARPPHPPRRLPLRAALRLRDRRVPHGGTRPAGRLGPCVRVLPPGRRRAHIRNGTRSRRGIPTGRPPHRPRHPSRPRQRNQADTPCTPGPSPAARAPEKSAPSPGSASPSPAARPSASWGSPAAASPPSGGWSSAWSRRRTARSASRAATSAPCPAGNCAPTAATCS
ncbi:hypothetical protein SRIMM317S_00088 [Streptomyces rimosus subsp. rimosus]